MKNLFYALLVVLLAYSLSYGSELTTLTAAIDAVDNYVDTEIATIDGIVDALRDSLEDANDILQKSTNVAGMFGYAAPNFKSVTVDHSNAAWDDAATNEVFDVTGNIEFWLCVYDSVLMGATNATDSLRFLLGTNLLWSCLCDGLDAGEFIPFGTAAAAGPTLTTATANCIDSNLGTVRYHGYSMGLDIGYEHVTAVCLTGFTRWMIWWIPLDPTGTVVVGAGGTL